MLEIRVAKESDLDEIAILCGEHAKYEEADWTMDQEFKARLASLIFNTGNISCLVVQDESGLIGYATYTKQFATWTATCYLYLDCLFLRPKARGLGIGSAIMTQIAEEMKGTGLNEIQWQTPSSNVSAISFYKNLGATERSKSRFVWNP